MVNRLKTLPKELQKILREISAVADSSGYRVYLVGGVVRDLLLRRRVLDTSTALSFDRLRTLRRTLCEVEVKLRPKGREQKAPLSINPDQGRRTERTLAFRQGKVEWVDLDIVVEGDAINLARMLAGRLKGAFQRHHAFGTAIVTVGKHKIDFATARIEHYTHWGALPKVKPATLTEDLFRRDFTINAMAIGLNKHDYGRLIDNHHGWEDLKRGIIRILHPHSFLDDPTRILRAVRFERRFSFTFARSTARLLQQALDQGVLKLISQHRIRDELILILKEPLPRRYLKRMNALTGLSFISPFIKLGKDDYSLFARIEHAITHYHRKYGKQRLQHSWLMYFSALILRLSTQRLCRLLHDLALRKEYRLTVFSIKQGCVCIEKLKKPLAPHLIYQLLSRYSQEALLFFYAYYPQRTIRKKIDYFIETLSGVKLKVRGKDLKRLGFEPESLYGRLLEELLFLKLDKGLKNKKAELEVARALLVRLPKNRNHHRIKRLRKRISQ